MVQLETINRSGGVFEEDDEILQSSSIDALGRPGTKLAASHRNHLPQHFARVYREVPLGLAGINAGNAPLKRLAFGKGAR
jgi:hypothetical protein